MSGKITRRTVKLTVRSLREADDDGFDRFDGFDGFSDGGAESDPFFGLEDPIIDVEDAVIRKLEERDFKSEPDALEIVTCGEFTFDGETAKISYDESFDGVKPSVKTEISFSARDPGVVAVVKTGETESVMVFESGRTHTTFYGPPGLPIELTVRTRCAVNGVSTKTGKGEMLFDYVVTPKGAFSSRILLLIRSE